jgi:hypothetical protein
MSEDYFLDCCPINEQTADGVRVGRCWHTLIDGRCPIHGDVRKAVKRYAETGRLTLESKHESAGNC